MPGQDTRRAPVCTTAVLLFTGDVQTKVLKIPQQTAPLPHTPLPRSLDASRFFMGGDLLNSENKQDSSLHSIGQQKTSDECMPDACAGNGLTCSPPASSTASTCRARRARAAHAAGLWRSGEGKTGGNRRSKDATRTCAQNDVHGPVSWTIIFYYNIINKT